MICLMAIASDPTDRGFLRSFYAFPRIRNSYTSAGITAYVYNSYSGSLFTYILAHCWYDFKNSGPDIPQNVEGAAFPIPIDWWANSKTAALINRQFCKDNSTVYSSYSLNSWGLSACFRPDQAYFGMNGAPPREYIPPVGGEPANDGTVPPYGAISTLPLMKDMETDNIIFGGILTNLAYHPLAHYYNDYYFRLWGPYGPRDSFNQFNKFSTIYRGINLGQTVLMMENYRSGLIWNIFMQDPRIAQARDALFRDTTPPVINRFILNDPDSPTAGYSHSATVNIDARGYDAVGIVKWLLTETETQPSINDFSTNGLTSAPVSYSFASGDGLKRLYIWAMDNSNNISSLSVNSQAQIFIDTTPPSMGAVLIDSPNANLVSQLHAAWSAVDAESGIIEYQYNITDESPSGAIIRNWTSTGVTLEVTAMGLSLIKGHAYYFNVKARNAAGLWSGTASSSGTTLVQSAPLISEITPRDGGIFEVDGTVPFNIIAADAEGDGLQYKVMVDGRIVFDWNASPSFDWQTTSETPGPRQAAVYVKDTWGNESYGIVSIYLARKALDAPQGGSS